MVLTPAVLSLCGGWTLPPCVGIFMLLFVGTLMASRLPTISLKSVHIPRQALPYTVAGLLLLIAFLAADFWLTIGVVGALYILTVPVTGFVFLKAKARYLRNIGGALDSVSPKV
jgi:CDP-diacylglycerol--serine O-phosphatidyltransferase